MQGKSCFKTVHVFCWCWCGTNHCSGSVVPVGASQQLVHFGGLWAAGGVRAVPNQPREHGLSSHSNDIGRERSSSSLLGSPAAVWVAMAGNRLLLGGWMKELLKKYQISPDLSQWLLKWKVCSITVNGQAFIILCYWSTNSLFSKPSWTSHCPAFVSLTLMSAK